MRNPGKYLLTALIILSVSCEIVENPDNDYNVHSEILLPTSSPFGLAYDGDYLWYSDDSLRCLNKISASGEILKTIPIPGCRITSFEFHGNSVWCINDTTLVHDTAVSHYPFSSIYKYSLSGEKTDTILVQGTINPIRPEFHGLTIHDEKIYFTTNHGWGSAIYQVDLESREQTFLAYKYLAGLTLKSDTIYAIDKYNLLSSRIAPFDSGFRLIEEKMTEVDFPATDLVFVGDHLWLINREEKKLVKK